MHFGGIFLFHTFCNSGCNDTLLQFYGDTVTVLYCIVTVKKVLQFLNVIFSSGTVLECYSAKLTQCYSVTVLQCYTLKILYLYSILTLPGHISPPFTQLYTVK